MYLMEQLNSVFDSIEGFQPSHQALFSRSTCLWIWHADKIPPHIGISSNGLYFSLKVKGKETDLPVSVVLDAIQRKKIPSLCYLLSDQIEDLSLHFNAFHRAVAGEITCLFPIREALGLPVASQLSELLESLEQEGRIEKKIGFFLPEDFNGLPNYGMFEIHERLQQLADG